MNSKLTLVAISAIFLVLLASFSFADAKKSPKISFRDFDASDARHDKFKPPRGETTCSNSCGDCSAKLDGTYTKVTLTTDLINVGGICIIFGADNVIFDGGNNKIDSDNSYGYAIFMNGKSGNTVKNLIIEDYIESSSGGMYIWNSNNNIIENNIIQFNNKGIIVDTSYSNIIKGNTIKNNIDKGIEIISSSSNSIYNNNIISNTNQASDTGTNSWHNGYMGGGNYWSDYDTSGEGCNDTANDYNNWDGLDDICDASYLNGNVQDDYPFVSQDRWLSNRRPVLTYPAPNTVIDLVEGQTISIFADAIDPEGDTLDYSINPDPGFNQISGGSITFELPTGYDGSDLGQYIYTVTVDDNNGGQESRDVTVNVNDNTPPTLQPIADVIANEESYVIVTLSASDPDVQNYGQELTYDIINDNDHFGVYSPPNTFIWMTGAYSSGSYTFTAIVDDGEMPIEQTFNVHVQNTCRWNKPWFFRTGQWFKCDLPQIIPNFY